MRERKVKKTVGTRRHAQMTFADRRRLEKALKKRSTIADIAMELGINPSTIYRELRQNGVRSCAAQLYNAETAQEKADQRKLKRSSAAANASAVIDFPTRVELERLLTTTRLPLQQVAEKVGISRETLYKELNRVGLRHDSAYRYNAKEAQEAWERWLG